MEPFKILDGAIGSELIRRGVTLPEHTWSADSNIKYPDIVGNIHREYVDAGADYITTNTFRTTPRAYKKTGNKMPESSAKSSLYKAVELAKYSACNSVQVIGSIAPLEDCYLPDLFPGKDVAISEFSKLGKWLTDAGVDILLFETMNSAKETEAAIISVQNSGLPIWISFVLKDDYHLLSGDCLIETLNLLKDSPIDTVLINCNPLDRSILAAENIVSNWPHKWGAYPNLGVGEPSSDGYIIHYEKMDRFLSTLEKIIALGPSVIGGCCGSSSYHISKLFKLREQFDCIHQ